MHVKQLEQVSIDFDVLSSKTAMLGRMQLTKEQQEAIAAGKEQSTIYANAPEPIGLDELGRDLAIPAIVEYSDDDDYDYG